MIFLLILFSTSLSFAASFENVSNFQANHLSGWADARCVGTTGSYSRSYFCRTHDLVPSNFLYFIHSTTKTNASKVTLIAKNEKGIETKKNQRFNPKKGRTNSEVNLWSDSVFNRSLLSVGRNEITYLLMDSQKNILEEGSFEVYVEDIIEKSCSPRIIFGNSPGACENETLMCDEYFDRAICK